MHTDDIWMLYAQLNGSCHKEMSPIPFFRILAPAAPCFRKRQTAAVAYVMGLQIVWNEGAARVFLLRIIPAITPCVFLSEYPECLRVALPVVRWGGRAIILESDSPPVLLESFFDLSVWCGSGRQRKYFTTSGQR